MSDPILDEREIARRRGERVRDLADTIIAEFLVAGFLSPTWADSARVVLFHVLADNLYGNAAIDIPPRKGGTP